jgi:AcrR family transcriptional regulator
MGIPERKQREFDRREREILDAALNLFDSDDWLSITVEQIANAAEIGKGTIYKHFPGKDAIYARLTLAFYQGLLGEFEVVDWNREVVPLFRELAYFALFYHLQHPEYRRVVQYCKRSEFKQHADPELTRGFQELDARFDEFSTMLVRRGIEAGVFVDRSTEALKYGMHATFEGAVNTLWEGFCWGRDFDERAFIEAIVEFMLGGLMLKRDTCG